jgi:endonuclease/exonuclease/phosphatase family metal-dependent hydrolase
MKTAGLRIVTINILNDLSQWEARRRLLAPGLAETQPDLLALQEINLPTENAAWLAGQLGMDHLYITPKSGPEGRKEGIAILSRLPIRAGKSLVLPGEQGRVAQCVEVTVGEYTLYFANVHLFWQPGESETRQQQVDALIAWLKGVSGNFPTIVCGDFNATPETGAIQTMYRNFRSAYAAVHGHEPAYTCPTPLKRTLKSRLVTLRSYFVYLRPQHINPFWRGTLDYIFTSPSIQVNTCQVILDQPAERRKSIYPSDHFGLYADLTIGAL